jgi:14-3-3 protein epsilon
MKGDYFRYIGEFAQGAYRNQSAKNAQESYQSALTLAENTLDSAHPNRIGLALNYSVFNYEILNQQNEAIKIAQKAFDEGISNLGSLSDEQAYKDSKFILNLIQDNISLWTLDQYKLNNNSVF